jgi:general secretion pathway protein B
MSFILDALKKSEQQRQLGTTPNLQFAQLTPVAPKRPSAFNYGLLAIVLLAAGVMIGLLRPWQTEQMPTESVPITREAPVTIPQQAAPAPLEMSPELPGTMKPNNPAPANDGTTSAAASIPDKSISESSANITSLASEQAAISFDDLPIQVQRQFPELSIQLHSYSSKTDERLVYINSTRMREGESVMPGLVLEQITPDGMIFSYKGYRFKRGIR